MNVSGSSPKHGIDMRDYCAKLELQASNSDDAIMLAVLHNTLLMGGKVTIEPNKKAAKLSNVARGKVVYKHPGCLN